VESKGHPHSSTSPNTGSLRLFFRFACGCVGDRCCLPFRHSFDPLFVVVAVVFVVFLSGAGTRFLFLF
jgi:hypothetical protein